MLIINIIIVGKILLMIIILYVFINGKTRIKKIKKIITSFKD
jgi:hypothetical protein